MKRSWHWFVHKTTGRVINVCIRPKDIHQYYMNETQAMNNVWFIGDCPRFLCHGWMKEVLFNWDISRHYSYLTKWKKKMPPPTSKSEGNWYWCVMIVRSVDLGSFIRIYHTISIYRNFLSIDRESSQFL